MSYVSEVANSIFSQSRSESVLGPEIYTVIAEWEKNEIPLPVVMASIGEFCEETGTLEVEPETVETFNAVVSRNFTNWLKDQ
jgi:hypothetical protein